jgi:hypothetical protein
MSSLLIASGLGIKGVSLFGNANARLEEFRSRARSVLTGLLEDVWDVWVGVREGAVKINSSCPSRSS